MRFSPLLLRLLLILALTANGTTSAFAATQMQVEYLDAATVDASQDQPASVQAVAPPCHEHPATGTLSTEIVEAVTAGMVDAAVDTDHGSPDCCQSAKCLCACLHNVAATAVSVHLLQVSIDRATSVRILKMGHAEPALPHLIRPPIG